MSSPPKRGPGDPSFVSREKKPSPVGTGLFIGLRAADALLQYNIFLQGWATALVSGLGGAVVGFASPANPALAWVGLGPYPALISALAFGNSLKHIVWALGVNEQEMTLSGAVIISTANSVINTLSTLFSVWTLTSQAPPVSSSASLYDVVVASPLLAGGLILYTVGMATELGSELQRKKFKSNPENKGKPYGGGLWKLATNINYGGFTLWRAGAALCAGGPLWGVFIGSFFFYDFTSRAIPSMDVFLTEKYGASYEEIKKATPYKLIPFVY